MTVSVRLTEYTVAECGFHLPRSSASFGSFAELADDLGAWLPGKGLGETKTFEPSRATAADLEVFMAAWSVDARRGLACAIVWVELPASAGSVLSINPASIVGPRADIHANAVRAGEVPGYPCYFVLDAPKDRFFTVRFPNGLVSPRQFYAYAEGFLAHYSSRVQRVMPRSRGLGTITGYLDDAGHLQGDAHPRFYAQPRRVPSKLAQLHRLQSQIFRVERKVQFNIPTGRVPGDLLTSALRLLGVGVAQHAARTEHHLRYSMRMKPSKEEITAMVESLPQDEDDSWSDLGFHLRDRSAPIWVRKALRAEDIVIDVALPTEALFAPADVLLAAIGDKLPR